MRLQPLPPVWAQVQCLLHHRPAVRDLLGEFLGGLAHGVRHMPHGGLLIDACMAAHLGLKELRSDPGLEGDPAHTLGSGLQHAGTTKREKKLQGKPDIESVFSLSIIIHTYIVICQPEETCRANQPTPLPLSATPIRTLV